jgi:hypothetical protein
MPRDLSNPNPPLPPINRRALTAGVPNMAAMPSDGQDGNAAQVAAALTQQPAPGHEQTVAGLRHFAAIRDQLTEISKDSDLGRVSVKGKVIDGMTKLVAERVMTAGDAVVQLAAFPEKPHDQKLWVAQHLATNTQAQAALLDHHRATHVGTGEWALESQTPRANPDDHRDHIGALMEHYKKGTG